MMKPLFSLKTISQFFAVSLVLVPLFANSGLKEVSFAEKHCGGDCKALLLAERDPKDALTDDEHYVIQYYTQGYEILDQSLFLQAVTKLPQKKGRVYRGTSLKYFPNLSRGATLTFDRITSTSASRLVAEGFVKDALFVIESKTARDISSYSVTDEKESILLPGARFRVTKISKESIDLSEQNEVYIIQATVIYLTEI